MEDQVKEKQEIIKLIKSKDVANIQLAYQLSIGQKIVYFFIATFKTELQVVSQTIDSHRRQFNALNKKLKTYPIRSKDFRETQAELLLAKKSFQSSKHEFSHLRVLFKEIRSNIVATLDKNN